MGACAVVAASEFNGRRFCELAAAGAFECVVAVDGGYAHLKEAGYSADVAIGDFDSLGFVPHDLPVERFDACKDESDLELALAWASERGFSRAYVFAALGGRLDHTLANLQVLAKCSESGMGIMVEGADAELAFLSGPAELEIPARQQGTVSVFSMSDECLGVCERGLKWELDHVRLTSRTSLGLSNEFRGEPASISVRSGTLVVFLPL